MALSPSLTGGGTPLGQMSAAPFGTPTVASPLAGGGIITPIATPGFTAGPAALPPLSGAAAASPATIPVAPTVATPLPFGTPAAAGIPTTVATPTTPEGGAGATTQTTPPPPVVTTTPTAATTAPATATPLTVQADSLSLPAGTDSTIAAAYLLANDQPPLPGDPLHLVALSAAQNAAVALTAPGDVSFTPAAGFIGTASFTYTAADQQLGQQASAPVQVRVLPLPLAPQTVVQPQATQAAALSPAAQQLLQIEAHFVAADPPPADHPAVHDIPLLV